MGVEKAVGVILISGAITSSIVAIIVVAVPVVAPMVTDSYRIPQEVKEWGGVIIGFYFGSFITFAVTVLEKNREKTRPGP